MIPELDGGDNVPGRGRRLLLVFGVIASSSVPACVRRRVSADSSVAGCVRRRVRAPAAVFLVACDDGIGGDCCSGDW